MLAEFEEKSFEIPLNAELSPSHLIYAPGQVLENIIGMDAALVCSRTNFWKLFSSPRTHNLCPAVQTPAGIRLNPSYWKELDRALDLFPPTKFNLFLQYKRPELLTDKRSKQWNLWGTSYFRYDIVTHQQTALATLAQIAQEDALVGYACAAFHSNSELWHYAMQLQLVENTNFVKAEGLTGHSQYTFVAPGAGGQACSDPVEIENFDLLAEAARLRERRRGGSNKLMILRLGKYVRKAAEESGLGKDLENLARGVPGDVSLVAQSILRIHAFASLTKSRWLLGY